MNGILKVGKKYARKVINAMQVPGYKLGSTLLRSDTIRQYCNQALEKSGPRFADTFILLFDNSLIRSPFEWQTELAQKHFRLPVFPELQRTWNDALVWRWAGNRAIRKFYEIYLRSYPGGVFFDVGANDGTHTYPFAANGYVCVCFEPQADCVAYIRRTLELNQFHLVRVEPLAVSDQNIGQVEFYTSKSSWYSSLTKENVEQFETVTSFQTKAITLDTFCVESGLTPTLIKIDVEGGEWNVIQGGRRVFESVRPNVFAEISADRVNVERCWDFFSQLGYKIYFLKHYTSQPFYLMNSVDECVKSIGNGRNGDFIFLSDMRLIKELDASIKLSQQSNQNG